MTTDQAAIAAHETRDVFSLRRLFLGSAGWSMPYVQLLGYLLVVLQCGAVLALVHRFHLENELFQQIVTIAMAGFLVHHWLPARLRLPFFVALSLGSVAYFFGLDRRQWYFLHSLQRTATLLAVGGLFIALCHLPVRYALRVAVLITSACGLAVFRAGWVHFGPLDAIWPVLGAMFMFRLLIYAYDIEHDEEHPSLSQTLAYFFLFPAVWLFVFPVIDLRTFRSTYFNDRPLMIYNKGVQWMFRGIVQLLLWRLVYYHAYLDPSRVANGTDLMQYLVSNVALYFRVSGQFHFVIGLLHLFGFHLPESHRRYFLASSFTDYWRRINIYWKDFITRLVYYPLVLRLKTWPTPRKVLLATAVAFFATWFLHAYQWFWLRGAFPLEPKDILFWGAFGCVVSLNSIRELSKGRRRSLSRPAATWRDNLKLGLRTGGTFMVLLVLWSIWSCDTVTQWVDIWTLADRATLFYGILLFLAIAIAAILMEGPATPWAARAQAAKPAEPHPFPWRYAVLTCLIPAACLYVLSSYRARAYYPTGVAEWVKSLSRTSLNTTDQEYLVRGYYENLMDGSRFNNLLTNAFTSKPPDARLVQDTEAARGVADLRLQELVPSKNTLVNGKTIAVNRWGMRDRDYELAKELGVCRIAVLGASHTMGHGVENDQTFEALVEDQLNRRHSGGTWKRFEVLNFAFSGYAALAHVEQLRKTNIAAFQPDFLFYFAHEEQIGILVRRLAEALSKGIEPEYDFVRQVVREAGVTSATPRLRAEGQLRLQWPRLTEWAFGEIVQDCRRNHIRPVWVFLPAIATTQYSRDAQTLTGIAQRAGFQTINLFGVYDVPDRSSLIVAPWDDHPNTHGHRRVADALYREIVKGGVIHLGGQNASISGSAHQ